jgi:hypothetical protein
MYVRNLKKIEQGNEFYQPLEKKYVVGKNMKALMQ